MGNIQQTADHRIGADENAAVKTVLLGVTGGVSIYKSCEVIRGLQKQGIRVKVVMTEHATHFIDPSLFRSLTREPVGLGLFDNPSDPIHHISLAKEADVFCIAPCTANAIGKIANGIADDLLTTTVMARTSPLIVAPAMNVNMYESAANQANLATLAARGVKIVEAADGYLACGDTGKGKLAPVEDIVSAIMTVLNDEREEAPLFERDLQGKRVLITAGPTREPIDPVRYISNPSTGKMGFALAAAAQERGADVVLVSGPVELADPEGVEVHRVQTALEMMQASAAFFPQCDIAIFTAAVSDMRPVHVSDRKLKKGRDDAQLANIELTQNPDILKTLAHQKGDQVVIGFAAETDDVIANATKKLNEKGADMIVANDVSEGKGFGADDNRASFVFEVDGADAVESLPVMTKRALADEILSKAVSLSESN